MALLEMYAGSNEQMTFSNRNVFSDFVPLEASLVRAEGESQNRVVFDARAIAQKEKRAKDSQTLDEYVAHFDTYWKDEGLPTDWYNLSRVGFSMDTQMNMLQGEDSESVARWTRQTKQDILGFSLEYLSRELVYPARYERIGDKLMDTTYEKDIEDLTSPQERNGKISQTVKEVKQAMLGADEEVLRVVTSPMGETGLTMDDGRFIFYPDSYFFVFHKPKDSNTVTNYTIKTDFTLHETREVIKILTGREVLEGASATELVRVLATNEDVQKPADVVAVLEQVRSQDEWRQGLAFKHEDFNKIYQGIERENELYTFSKDVHRAVSEFEETALQGGHSKFELKKLLAATLLRNSKTMLIDEQQLQSKLHLPGFISVAGAANGNYGEVYAMMQAIDGCQGGSAVVESIVHRIGVPGGDASVLGERKLKCKMCPLCEKPDIIATIANGKITCPSCKKSAPYEC